MPTTLTKVHDIAAVDTRVPFIGRAVEMQSLLEMLARGGALTLVGAGGVGKSRLAYEAALRYEEIAHRRVVFVRLAGIDAEAVTGTVMHALGIHDEPARAQVSSLRDILVESPVTLILDNCEHAPDETSALIDALAGIPKLAVLATSQRRLDYSDETVLEIEPFARDDGVAFFLARAQLREPDLRALDIITRIVERLDGLAVAIDLAAARLASLTLAELAEQLNELRPYQLRSTRGSEPRHRTIGNVIAWSYSQLSPEAKRVFALSSVFSDVFDDQDIVALAGVDELQARRLLDELAESSLVVRAEFGARMLAPIRAVATRTLNSTTNRRPVEAAFAARVNAIAGEIWHDLHTDGAGAAMQRIFVRYADFCSVLAWALKRPQERLPEIQDILTAALVLWADGGRFTEGLRWVERLESVAERLSPHLRGKIYYEGLVIAHAASDYARMLEAGPSIISAFTISDDRLGLARAYNALATASLNLGRIDEAATYVELALRLYQQLDHHRGVGAALINKGTIAFEAYNDIPIARSSFNEAIVILRTLGAATLTGIAYGNLAEVEHVAREYDFSDELVAHAIDRFEVTAGLPSIAWQYHTLARNAMARGRNIAAREALLTACDLLRRSPQVLYLAQLTELVAALLLRLGAEDESAYVAQLAARLRRERSLPVAGFMAGAVQETNRRLRELMTDDRMESAVARAAGVDLAGLTATLTAILKAADQSERDRSEPAPANT